MQGVVAWEPPAAFWQALKTMHVSRMVAWAHFWVLLGPQRAPKAPPRSHVGASWKLLGRFLGLPWSPFGVPATSRASKSDGKSLFDANLSSQLAFGAPKITSQLAFGAPASP